MREATTETYRASAPEGGFSGLPSNLHRAGKHALGKAMYRPGNAWLPPVNLYEMADKFLVCADLAGVTREQIDITVKEGVLRLEGHRQDPLPEKKRVHLLEIDEGFFCREVEIPAAADVDHIEATYEDGFLWVHLPKK